MKSLIHKLLVEHWPRKLLALLLSTVIWFVVNKSLTDSRVFHNIPVRIINIPPGKTVEGFQAQDGRPTKKINVTLVGSKTLLEELNSHDFEIVLDAKGKPDEWKVNLSTKNIAFLHRAVDLTSGLKRMYHQDPLVLHMANVVTDKVPVIITRPIGEAPRGYQFLDMWPYRLWVSVTGSETMLRQLKSKEQYITFNLSAISKEQLDALSNLKGKTSSENLSFIVPEQWKQLSIPLLSDELIAIDDPEAKQLRMDFIHCSTIPLDAPLPVRLYFPPNTGETFNPDKIKLAESPLVKEVSGMTLLNLPLYAKGTDRLFAQIVRNRMQLTILVSPKLDGQMLDWSLEFIDSRHLEDLYVASLMAAYVPDSDIRLLKVPIHEEHLRNRFRSYMKNLQLFQSDDLAFEPIIQLKEDRVYISHHTD